MKSIEIINKSEKEISLSNQNKLFSENTIKEIIIKNSIIESLSISLKTVKSLVVKNCIILKRFNLYNNDLDVVKIENTQCQGKFLLLGNSFTGKVNFDNNMIENLSIIKCIFFNNTIFSLNLDNSLTDKVFIKNNNFHEIPSIINNKFIPNSLIITGNVNLRDLFYERLLQGRW